MLHNRLTRLFLSILIAAILMFLLVMATPKDEPARILVMLGGTMPEGIIQGATYMLFIFGGFDLFAIHARLAYEEDSFTAHFLPEKENWIVSDEDVTKLKLNMQDIEHSHKYYLTDLIKKCCTKYRLSKSSSETLSLVEAQVKIYSSELDSEQAFIRYVAWAIPSVGFIGTVLGIAASLGYANEASTPEGIEKVTSMLAVAFDTTLVALFLSIFLMFGIHYIEKKKETLFSHMSSYVIENLINRFYK